MPTNKLWNTGVDDQGKKLPPNSQDPHWYLVSAPPGVKKGPAVVVTAALATNYHSTTDSAWVGATADGRAIGGSPAGPPYVFETKFSVDTDSEHWIQIIGSWGVDNCGQITIDGGAFPPGSASGEISLSGGTVVLATNFTQTHSFAISNLHPRWLSPGEHTLEVTLYDQGTAAVQHGVVDNPAAFNVNGAKILVNTLESARGQIERLLRSWQRP